jgi:hypothetical protein
VCQANIRGLNLATVRLTGVIVTRLPLVIAK